MMDVARKGADLGNVIGLAQADRSIPPPGDREQGRQEITGGEQPKHKERTLHVMQGRVHLEDPQATSDAVGAGEELGPPLQPPGHSFPGEGEARDEDGRETGEHQGLQGGLAGAEEGCEGEAQERDRNQEGEQEHQQAEERAMAG